MKKLLLKTNNLLINLIDIVKLMNFRDAKSQSSESIINRSLRIVCKQAIVNRLFGGIGIVLSLGIFLTIIGAFTVTTLLRFPGGLGAFYLLCLALLCTVFYKVILKPLLSVLNKEKIALLIEQKYPSLNNSLISSLQLSKGRKDAKKIKYSGQMVSMLVENTSQKLKQLDIQSVVDKKFLFLGNAILIFTVLLFGGVYAFHRSSLDKNIPLFFSYLSDRSKIIGDQFAGVSTPVIADITVSYRYPLYSGLEKKTIYNTSGDVKALKGSEAQISATSDRPLASAKIIFNESSVIPLTIENKKTMSGVLPLLDNGSYCFELTDERGNITRDQALHTVEVIPDHPPGVSINAPAKDLVVNEKDAVNLQYNAKDDYGLTEISLVYEVGNEKNARALSRFSKRQILYNGAYKWSLSELNLRPDDKVAYYLEAKDNDTISGPKTGRSKTYYLEIYSSRKKHQELIQLQELLVKEALRLLSDDLVNRIDDERCSSKEYLLMRQDIVKERADVINRLFTDILVGMQDDTVANYSVYYSLENLRKKFRDVTELKQRTIQKSMLAIADDNVPLTMLAELQILQDAEVTEVEDMIMFLNEMIQKQKLDEVIDAGKDLIQSQNTLEKLLDQLRETGDMELSEKALAELKNIENMIQQMMMKLMQMAQSEHMDEFLNADAMKGIEQDDIMKDLNEMKNALKNGDAETALQAAKRMLSSLQRMMDQMNSSSQELTDSFYSDTLKKMDKALDSMSELENKQRTLAEKTEDLKKDIQERASESMNETLQSFFEKQEKRIEEVKRDIAATKEYLAKNELLQEYLQTKQQLRQFSEQRVTPMPLNQFSELFGRDDTSELSKEDAGKLSELTRKNAELNREINRDPLLRDFLYIDKELPQTEEALSHLEEMLKGKDINESLELAREVAQNTNHWNNRMQDSLEMKKQEGKELLPEEEQKTTQQIEDAAKQSQEIARDLESMAKFLDEHRVASMNQEDQERLKQYAEKQGEYKNEADEIMEMLDQLSHQTPFMDEEANRQLEMASNSMSGAKERLEGQDVPGAVIEERESLYRLAEAKKGVQQAKEHIKQGMMGEGMPMPFRGRMEEGQVASTSEKVEIPSEDAYKVPKKFREEILDALKEGLPEKYRDLNKDYYQRLVD
ncbi:MAG: DUF4175 domain-containing protein [Candidatus Kuenenia sp.]|nr:DUF4175 domain-containing protein [Candidatus Kuenenia hertensis]